jgi:hypothetical protein
MTQAFRIGTAGWNVPSRYLAQVALGASHLERHARHLNAVEINSSFYRPHRRATYQRWAQSVPDGFRGLPPIRSRSTGRIRRADGKRLHIIAGTDHRESIIPITAPPRWLRCSGASRKTPRALSGAFSTTPWQALRSETR